jgi:hypothetical protein
MRDAGAACTGGDAGTVCLVSQCNKLPAAWTTSNPADFSVSNDGGAAPYVNALVEFTAQTTTQGATDGGTAGCPTQLIYQTYCDGFQATASGGSFLVDTYDYAASPAACAAQGNGATLPSITGIWYYVSGAYAVAIRTCADLGVGAPYAGAGTAPATPAGSQTVHSLLASSPTDGQTVTVSGVAIAVTVSVDGDITVALEDASGGPNSATQAYKLAEAAGTVTPPQVGDYVTVTGTWSASYQNVNF